MNSEVTTEIFGCQIFLKIMKSVLISDYIIMFPGVLTPPGTSVSGLDLLIFQMLDGGIFGPGRAYSDSGHI
jgi:hypothetical protein